MRIPKTNRTIYIVRGKEKFWNALLGGALVAPVTVLALYGLSGPETFEPPSPAELRVAVAAFIAGSFASALAFTSPNSDVPGSGTPGGKLAERLAEVEAELAAARARLLERVAPEATPPQPSTLAVQPLRPEPRPAERTDEDEAG